MLVNDGKVTHSTQANLTLHLAHANAVGINTSLIDNCFECLSRRCSEVVKAAAFTAQLSHESSVNGLLSWRGTLVQGRLQVLHGQDVDACLVKLLHSIKVTFQHSVRLGARSCLHVLALDGFQLNLSRLVLEYCLVQLVRVRPLCHRVPLQQLLHEVGSDGVTSQLAARDSVCLLALIALVVLLLGRLEVALSDAAARPTGSRALRTLQPKLIKLLLHFLEFLFIDLVVREVVKVLLLVYFTHGDSARARNRVRVHAATLCDTANGHASTCIFLLLLRDEVGLVEHRVVLVRADGPLIINN